MQQQNPDHAEIARIARDRFMRIRGVRFPTVTEARGFWEWFSEPKRLLEFTRKFDSGVQRHAVLGALAWSTSSEAADAIIRTFLQTGLSLFLLESGFPGSLLKAVNDPKYPAPVEIDYSPPTAAQLAVIVGIPVDAPGYTPGPGYLQSCCERCGISIWLGPKQIAARAQFGNHVFCGICIAESIGGKSRYQQLNPDSGSVYDPAAFEAGADDFLNDMRKRRHPLEPPPAEGKS